MKAIVNTGPGILELRDLPRPEPGPGEVRIRTGACGICATDLEMIAGWDRTGFPAIPGHEWSGTVDALGAGVDAALVGRRCVGENELRRGGEVGFEYPGGYAEYLLTESANVYPLPDTFPFSTATLIEPLAVCVRGLRRLRCDGAQRVLIFGDGPIGLLITALLIQRGAAHVVVAGGRSGRLRLAEAFGAARTLNINGLTGEFTDAVRAAVGRGFSHVVEATGSESALRAAFDLADATARILFLGEYRNARADFRWTDLQHRELEIIGSNASAGAWPEAVQIAINGSVPLERLITHRLPAARFDEGMALVRSRAADVVKVVLEWE